MTVAELKEELNKAKDSDNVIFKAAFGFYGDVNKVVVDTDERFVILYEK